MRGAITKLLRDLLYGGENEYLDIVRLSAAGGVLLFFGLSIAKAFQGPIDLSDFAGNWVLLLPATAAAVGARQLSDRYGRVRAIPKDAER